MRILRVALLIAVLLMLAVIGFVWWSQEPLIAGLELPPQRADFAADLLEKGARLAAIGNCAVCHTVPGGTPYAGGRPIATPFGTIYGSNITPALGTGVGRWSEAAFRRVMREGVARRGEHLFPAFPYDHFTRLTDEDIHALYAFIMTRSPVEIATPARELRFPFNQRWLLPFWNLLYLNRAPFRPDPQQSAAWNRGAYLVAGLGHCGGCHTPRNFLAAERSGQALAGGESEGWRAPPLNAASPAPVPWEAGHLFAYLRHGRDSEHGGAAGPMQPVAGDLARADEADLRAIAIYLAAQQGEVSPERRQRAVAALEQAAGTTTPKPAAGEELAAAIFAGACAVCHAGGPAMVPPRGIDLSLSTAINDSDPRNAIFILLDGIRPLDGLSGPSMPRFDGALTDAQLAALLRYLRAHYSDRPAWTDLERNVRDIRHSKERS